MSLKNNNVYAIHSYDNGYVIVNSQWDYYCRKCGSFHSTGEEDRNCFKFSTLWEAEAFLADYIYDRLPDKEKRDFQSVNEIYFGSNGDFTYLTANGLYLWKNRKWASTTGSLYTSNLKCAPGYWRTKKEAEQFVNSLKGKKMDNLDTKIEQCKKDIEALQSNLIKLEGQKKNSVFQVSQVFKRKNTGDYFQLTVTDFDDFGISLVSLQNGLAWGKPFRISVCAPVTWDVIDRIYNMNFIHGNAQDDFIPVNLVFSEERKKLL